MYDKRILSSQVESVNEGAVFCGIYSQFKHTLQHGEMIWHNLRSWHWVSLFSSTLREKEGEKKSSNTNHTWLSVGEVFSQEYLFLDLHLCCMILIYRYLKRMIIKISPCGWLLLALPGNWGHSLYSQSSPRHPRNGELLNLQSSPVANKLRNYVGSWKQTGIKRKDIIVTD